MKSVLITDDCHPLLKEGLERLGYDCDYEPDITPADTAERIHTYSGLIINSKILVNRDFLERASLLEFVGRLGSGMEIVDSLYKGYGEGAPRGRGPDQGRIQGEGNSYLKAEFPQLDYVKKASVL